jgi:hypothetical protein
MNSGRIIPDVVILCFIVFKIITNAIGNRAQADLKNLPLLFIIFKLFRLKSGSVFSCRYLFSASIYLNAPLEKNSAF